MKPHRLLCYMFLLAFPDLTLTCTTFNYSMHSYHFELTNIAEKSH